jgi:hypothetical protein
MAIGIKDDDAEKFNYMELPEFSQQKKEMNPLHRFTDIISKKSTKSLIEKENTNDWKSRSEEYATFEDMNMDMDLKHQKAIEQKNEIEELLKIAFE